jgi:hypothetical protein
MTALTSSLWYLADPNSNRKLVAFAVSFYMITKYYERKP